MSISSLPLEFVVIGTPISQQGSGPNKSRWKSNVLSEAQKVWPSTNSPLDIPLQATIVYYYENESLDVDNMEKPILDSLNGCIYVDDNQITDSNTSKRKLGGSYKLKGLSSALAQGFCSGKEFVYIKISTPPNPEEIIS